MTEFALPNKQRGKQTEKTHGDSFIQHRLAWSTLMTIWSTPKHEKYTGQLPVQLYNRMKGSAPHAPKLRPHFCFKNDKLGCKWLVS